MAASASDNPTASRLSPEARNLLLRTAADSIEYGLHRGEPFPVVVDRFPEVLREVGASFVTLERHRELRGCIGTLNARRPLILDVAENAFAAANRDTRFDPIRMEELQDLEIHLSILNPPEPLAVSDEADLCAKLRPGVDGVILEDARHRGTFLPAVWEDCPDPVEFVRHLKRKAGLPADYWAPDLRFSRYTVECIP